MEAQNLKISFDTQGLALSNTSSFFYIRLPNEQPIISHIDLSQSPSCLEPHESFRSSYGSMLYLDRLDAFAAMYAMYQARVLAKSVSRASLAVEQLSHEGVVDALDYGMVLQSVKETPFNALATYQQLCLASHSIVPKVDVRLLDSLLDQLEIQPILCCAGLPITHMLGLQYMKLELEALYGIDGMELELLSRILDRLYVNTSSLQDWYKLQASSSPSTLFSDPITKAFLKQVAATLEDSSHYPRLRLVEYTDSRLELEYKKGAHCYTILFLNTPYTPELSPHILDASPNGLYCYSTPSTPPTSEWTLDAVIYSVWDSYRLHGIPHHQSLGPIGVKPY